jgi:hypothetical protein
MQNFPGLAIPGELGLGQSTATNIYNAFYLFSFLTPLPFAVLSDTRLGRYKTLCLSFWYEAFPFSFKSIRLIKLLEVSTSVGV